MDLRNCRRCGKAYITGNPTVCPDCVKVDQEDFMKVRDFVKENPKVSLEVVQEATGVPEDRIVEYLREGKLEAADLSGPILGCARCGKPIHKGEYCVLCRTEISNTFKQEPGARKKQDGKPDGSFTKRYKLPK